MRKNKLIKTGLLAMSLIIAGSSNAYAAPGQESVKDTNKSTSVDVQAKVAASDSKVYKVDINWGAMDFVFSSNETWDPVNHVNTGASGWVTTDFGNNNKISVTNHSNDNIVVNYSYNTESWVTGFQNNVVGNFFNDVEDAKIAAGKLPSESQSISDLRFEGTVENNTVDIKTAVGTGPLNAPSKDVFFALSGKPDTTGSTKLTEFTTIGKITLTIAGSANK